MPKKAAAKKEDTQPELNLGIVGHVDHGKTTLTKSLSGKWTDTHSEELKKGITIRLGYADFSVFKDSGKKAPACYSIDAGKSGKLVRKISIVDAPGHESLMATMLSGAAIFDGAILLVAANEQCPQPQTREHVTALQIIGIEKIVVVQNKIDLASDDQIKQNYKEIQEFLKDTPYKDAPIIPLSAQHNVNVDALLDAIEEQLPTPKRSAKDDPVMFVARSFDVNKPGTTVKDLSGGVLGGTLKAGQFKVGDKIELKPGRRFEKQGKLMWEPVTTTITALQAGRDSVEQVTPGGSIGVMTQLDPGIVKSDALGGNIAGAPGKLPPVWHDLKLEVNLLERVVGAKDELIVEQIKPNENLMMNVNSAATVGVVKTIKKGVMECQLRLPVCAAVGSRVTISRLLGSRWRLIGYGIIKE